MAKIQMQGLPGVWKSLTSAWEGINIAMTESGAFEDIISGAKKMTLQFRAWSQENPETLKQFGKFAIATAILTLPT